jgi:hypothetical protein
MQVTAWNNGGTGYGLKIDASDRDRFSVEAGETWSWSFRAKGRRSYVHSGVCQAVPANLCARFSLPTAAARSLAARIRPRCFSIFSVRRRRMASIPGAEHGADQAADCPDPKQPDHRTARPRRSPGRDHLRVICRSFARFAPPLDRYGNKPPDT